VSTFKEPYRLEGKKTMGIELAEQLGWRVPDVVVYPTGGGVGLIGIHKALGELRELGWIGPRLPRLVAVQAAGCAPIVRAFEQGKTESEPWPDPHTVAFGITVPKPLADFLILGALYATDGCAIAVDDEAIMEAERTCASSEGLFLCPEGAATVAAVERLVKMGWLQRDEEVVLLNTGTGLKYPESVRAQPPTLPRDGVLS
jgi:threonine synthase